MRRLRHWCVLSVPLNCDRVFILWIKAYATFVAILNLLAPAASGRVYSFHLSVVLFAVFAVYAYRNVWPLMTFTLHPLDDAEGRILWAKVALAALAGVIEPLFEPYPYIPVDPKVRLDSL